jgi:hypothetical protein
MVATRFVLSLALLAALPLSACSSSGDDAADDDGDPDAGPDPLGELTELVGADFEIVPGSEPYICTTLTATEDIYITGLKDESPPGTHHTVVSVAPIGEPDGEDRTYPCDVGDNEMQMLFASGVGSDELAMPDGVAIRVAAGQQIKLNVHLYNATTETLTGRAAVMVETVPAAEVGDVELAEMILAGDLILDIDDTGEEETEQGSCTMAAGTLINLWPHMHKLGRHTKVTLDGTTLLDEDYSFTEQKNWPMTVPLEDGQPLVVTCTYLNDTGATVQWGESSDEEMCFTGFYRYPAIGSPMVCGAGF